MITDFKIDDLLFNLSLYKEIEVDYTKLVSGEYTQTTYDNQFGEHEYTVYTTSYSTDFQHLINLLIDDKKIIGYCPFCNEKLSLKVIPVELDKDLKESRIHSVSEDRIEDDDYVDTSLIEMNKRIRILLQNKYLDKRVQCTHDNNHLFKFSFYLNFYSDKDEQKLTITKIGQYPSLSDFYTNSFKMYKSQLDRIGCYKDFTKGCYMYAHGLGIGSYTYLRRVFEKLINYAYKEHSQQLECEPEDFRMKRMDEKLNLLSKFLPSYLIENGNTIYKILSVGIHQLEEDACKKMFPILKTAIEIILEEAIHVEKVKRLKEETKNDMNAFRSTFNERM